MMNKKILKVLVATACAILLVVGSVAGTLAYLTAKTETITNTFTVGKVEIELNESDDAVGTEPKLIPGKFYKKDPKVTVKEGSETCWLFVKVVNEIAEIEDDENSIAAQMAENGWKALEVEDVAVPNVYYHEVVAAGTVPVFESFTVDGDITGEEMQNYSGKTITVTAYAVQSEGLNVAAAWDAVKDVATQS